MRRFSVVVSRFYDQALYVHVAAWVCGCAWAGGGVGGDRYMYRRFLKPCVRSEAVIPSALEDNRIVELGRTVSSPVTLISSKPL